VVARALIPAVPPKNGEPTHPHLGGLLCL
jgi:hypothetical protein